MSEVRQDPTHGKFGVAYFVCFQFMCSSVILNLIVAVILENFTSLGKSNSDLVSRKDIEQFRDTWADFDPHATQRIATAQLPDLLRKLPSPLGLPGAPHLWVARVCLNLGLESHGRKLAFREVLNALVSFNVQQQMRDELPPPGGEIEKSFKVRRAAEAHESSSQSFIAGQSFITDGSFTMEKRRAGSSMLWSSPKITDAQREAARIFVLLALRRSPTTLQLRRVLSLPRAERLAAFRVIRIEKRVLARFGAESKPSLVRKPTLHFGPQAVSFMMLKGRKAELEQAQSSGEAAQAGGGDAGTGTSSARNVLTQIEGQVREVAAVVIQTAARKRSSLLSRQLGFARSAIKMQAAARGRAARTALASRGPPSRHPEPLTTSAERTGAHTPEPAAEADLRLAASADAEEEEADAQDRQAAANEEARRDAERRARRAAADAALRAAEEVAASELDAAPEAQEHDGHKQRDPSDDIADTSAPETPSDASSTSSWRAESIEELETGANEAAAATRLQAHQRRRAQSTYVREVKQSRVQATEQAKREHVKREAQPSSPSKAELEADLRAATAEAEAAASSLRAELAKIQGVVQAARLAATESKRHTEVALAAQRVQMEAKAQAEAEARAHAVAKAQAETEARAHAEARAQAEAEARAHAEARARVEEEARSRAEALAEAQALAESQALAEAQGRAESEARAEANLRAAAPPAVTYSSTTTTIVTRTSHERFSAPAAAPGRSSRASLVGPHGPARAIGGRGEGGPEEDEFLARLHVAEAHDAVTAAAAEAAGLTIKTAAEMSPSKAITTSAEEISLQRHRRRECRDGGCGLCGINVFGSLSPQFPAITLSHERWGAGQQQASSWSDELVAERRTSGEHALHGHSTSNSSVKSPGSRHRRVSSGWPKEEDDWRRPGARAGRR